MRCADFYRRASSFCAFASKCMVMLHKNRAKSSLKYNKVRKLENSEKNSEKTIDKFQLLLYNR